ncbi:MAG TPA: SDR family oxidoreductase [Acetobacteraceae bacterium]|nr:SDR family oxidoreductase [Acetobacteraceae bacterium]
MPSPPLHPHPLENGSAACFALHGRRALVTGGSLGIGRAIALGFAEAGADVAIHHAAEADGAAKRASAAAEVVAAIKACGVRAHAAAADFTTPGVARGMVEAVAAAFGAPDILVICASIQTRADFLAVRAEEVNRQVAVNFAATIELLQAVLPAMQAAGRGRVLAIGSVNQTRPESELLVYAALKAAQHALILGLARRHAAEGITFNTLSPGLVATERNLWRRADAAAWAAIQHAANPMGRAGLPEDMVGAALLLCSDAGAFITGADLQATGGGHL